MIVDVWTAVDELLAFVLAPVPCARDEWPTLARLLDRLAVTVPLADAEYPESDLDSPDRDQGPRRDELCRRFPDFGFYAIVPPLGDGGALELREALCGDAIDDLLDISQELEEALWWREHGASLDGERYLAWSFRVHWGRHLRDLQSYLHRVAFEP